MHEEETTYPRKDKYCVSDLLELEAMKLRDFVEKCKNWRIESQKDSIEMVVRGFEFRGAATTTRSEVLVVEDVVSCLGDVTYVGRVDSG